MFKHVKKDEKSIPKVDIRYKLEVKVHVSDKNPSFLRKITAIRTYY